MRCGPSLPASSFLDVDATGLPALAADPVVAGLIAGHPGLRPVSLHSPHEAAAWAIAGNRHRMTQAARRHGPHRPRAQTSQPHCRPDPVRIPRPAALRAVTHVPGLSDIKPKRLHALAEAALGGQFDAPRLRALPGIGPFCAELVLIRGAGHLDVFPRREPRVHQAIATAYGLGTSAAADVTRLAGIADRGSPTAVGPLSCCRVSAQGTAGLACHGPRHCDDAVSSVMAHPWWYRPAAALPPQSRHSTAGRGPAQDGVVADRAGRRHPQGRVGLEQHGGRTIEGVGVRAVQRILMMNCAIRHSRITDTPALRSPTTTGPHRNHSPGCSPVGFDIVAGHQSCFH